MKRLFSILIAFALDSPDVFFTPKKKGGDVLVKVLLNGEEAQLGFLQPFSGPYYKWADVRTYLENRVSLFVDAKN